MFIDSEFNANRLWVYKFIFCIDVWYVKCLTIRNQRIHIFETICTKKLAWRNVTLASLTFDRLKEKFENEEIF